MLRLATGMGLTAMNLFTFGYEGLSVDVFIRRLKVAGVRTVVDVRQATIRGVCCRQGRFLRTFRDI